MLMVILQHRRDSLCLLGSAFERFLSVFIEHTGGMVSVPRSRNRFVYLTINDTKC